MNIDSAIRGMRNAKQSHHLSDSKYIPYESSPFNRSPVKRLKGQEFAYNIGKRDMELALKLCRAGSDHRKFMRQILVSMDIQAGWYWFKEFSTYEVGRVQNSSSTMHTITNRELTYDDFAYDEATPHRTADIKHLNELIRIYKKTKSKKVKRKIIQDLPASFLYTRTVTLNYEVLRNIYHSRKSHFLIEWIEFCNLIEKLPYSKLITTK